MFIFAFLIGIYSYFIFSLGIAGILYKDVIVPLTVIFWVIVVVWKRNAILNLLRRFKKILNDDKNKNIIHLCVILLALQAGVNFIGVLGPELAFDALWYHLTLPKLYLANHSVFYIPGGLLYYSAMPKLAEMLYIAGLSFGNEIFAKSIHFFFGTLTCLALYKLSRKFFTPVISLIAVVIFYSNLVVGWESIAAYVDLVRTFFEVMALWAFFNWTETKIRKWFIWSAIMLGLAITTKVLAIASLLIFSLLIIYYFLSKKRNVKNLFIGLIVYWIIALFVPLPWFVFSFIHTGNPVYPFFSEIYRIAPEPLTLFGFFKETWVLFTQSADPISPIYLMLLPLIIWFLVRRKMTSMTVIGIYSLLVIILWYFTPRTGGGRFILPYLPAFSLLCAAVVSEILQNKKLYGKFLGKFLLILIVSLSLLSIGYRLAANQKYVPVIVGMETKTHFLSSHLNFSYGDFYDVDGYFKDNITSEDKVLLYGFHNLYYVDFPFIDATWRKPEDSFNYVATQNADIPEEFAHWELVYENEQTMVKLYKESERLYSRE